MNYPSLWLVTFLLISTVALWKPAVDKSRVRAAWGFLVLWAALQIAEAFAARWLPAATVVNALSTSLLAFAAVQVIAITLFDLLLRRAGIPKFAVEVIIVGSYVAILVNLLYVIGVNVTGIFATSAVAAAVIGFALQDMLSNIAGGIALELEGGIRPGDFVSFGELSGWVQHVRLRHTAIFTRDGDTLVVPNSQLTRSPVGIFGTPHRTQIRFQMPYSVDPEEVIEAVQSSLRESPLAESATDPAPCCVVMAMTPGHIEYAALVWFTRPGYDTSAVSSVLVRIYFALKRAGIPAGEVALLLESRRPAPVPDKLLNAVNLLRRTPILRLLDDADLQELGSQLHYLSYGPGELLIRQGDAGESMYFVVSGCVSIVLRSADGTDRTISTIQHGDFFGEASLLTGEARGASAVAQSRVECYRLDKQAMHSIMDRRPELAEDMAVVMAHRRGELTALRDKYDADTARRREAEDQTQLRARIRRFFGLSNSAFRKLRSD